MALGTVYKFEYGEQGYKDGKVTENEWLWRKTVGIVLEHICWYSIGQNYRGTPDCSLNVAMVGNQGGVFETLCDPEKVKADLDKIFNGK